MGLNILTGLRGLLLLASVSPVAIATQQHEHHHQNLHRQTSSSPLVFAHYMITSQPPKNDYTTDIKLAKAAGIDAFAVNYGGVGCSWTQLEGWLQTFYNQATDLGFKLFLSMDTTVLPGGSEGAAMIVNLTNTYLDNPAQLKVNGKAMLSSFQVNPPSWNWQNDVISKIKEPILFLPGTLAQDAKLTASQNVGSGTFTWVHPASSVEEEWSIDQDFARQQTATGKPWMAGIASWFFKRMTADQNWLHAQDSSIFVDRWFNLLKLKPAYIEIISWNDFGESHYIGPASQLPAAQLATTDTYYGGLDHSAFLKMAAIFIKAYKAGETDITVEPADEDVFFFYRTQPAMMNGANDHLGLPENATFEDNNVYVVPCLAKSSATVYLNSGGNITSQAAPIGVSKYSVPWKAGPQTLTASRNMTYGEVNKVGPDIKSQLEKYNGNVVAM